MISAEELPAPKQLKMLMQSLAALDAINSPEWEYRYHSFDSNWNEGEEMGSIRDGSGDTVFVLFNTAGCFVKGFAHEFPVSGNVCDDFYAGVPKEFIEASLEPAFTPQDVSFCCWRTATDTEWRNAVPDSALDKSSFDLIQSLDGEETSYDKFSAEYFENDLNIEHIASVYRHTPMTKELAAAINPAIDYSKLAEDLNEIGYPIHPELRAKVPKNKYSGGGRLRRLFGG